MSFCYDMLHEIKRGLGENANQEYINHINLLKIIKQDIEEEKAKFKERIQGAEISLFIENIFTVDSNESKSPSEETSLVSIVKNVIEKKVLIEKLQEKMSERLGIINHLLANHALIQGNPATNGVTSVIKNDIRLINPNFGECKYSFNFYNKPINHQFDWANVFKHPNLIKPKKNIGKAKGTFKSKRYVSQMEVTKRSSSNAKTINHEQLVSGGRSISKTGNRRTMRTRRKSSEGLKSLSTQLFKPDQETDDETPHNVRLYYDPQSSLGTALLASKDTPEVSPFRIEEGVIPGDVKDPRNPVAVQGSISLTQGKESVRYTPIKTLVEPKLKILGMLHLP